MAGNNETRLKCDNYTLRNNYMDIKFPLVFILLNPNGIKKINE